MGYMRDYDESDCTWHLHLTFDDGVEECVSEIYFRDHGDTVLEAEESAAEADGRVIVKHAFKRCATDLHKDGFGSGKTGKGKTGPAKPAAHGFGSGKTGKGKTGPAKPAALKP
jgi:hypothetical protein